MNDLANSDHQKIVDDFECLISYCAGNIDYNPVLSELIITNLNTKLIAAKASLDAVIAVTGKYENTLTSCRNALAELDNSIGRLITGSKSFVSNVAILKRARSLIRSLQVSKESLVPLPGEKRLPSIVTAHLLQSHDRQLEEAGALLRHFLGDSNIVTFNVNDTYNLSDKLQNLQAISAHLLSVFHSLNHCINVRDDIMYNGQTGLIVRAQHIKDYFRTIHGEDSKHYKEVSNYSIYM